MQQNSIPLYEANGIQLPRLAFGTYNLSGETCRGLVKAALDHGISLIDTASYYGNEEDVGRALKDLGCNRDDVIISTKIWRTDVTPDKIIESAENSLKKLGVERIDILSPHWNKASTPIEDMMQAFDLLRQAGKIRAIGLSNFNVDMMHKVLATGIRPVIGNQVEMHPYLGQRAMYEAFRDNPLMRDENLALIAFSPLANGRVPVDPRLQEIAAEYGKTAPQIALRWILQRQGTIALFRADTPAQIAENINVFDFNLSDNHMAEIDRMTACHARYYEHPSMKKKWDKASAFSDLSQEEALSPGPPGL